jgi:hypothetical protein
MLRPVDTITPSCHSKEWNTFHAQQIDVPGNGSMHTGDSVVNPSEPQAHTHGSKISRGAESRSGSRSSRKPNVLAATQPSRYPVSTASTWPHSLDSLLPLKAVLWTPMQYPVSAPVHCSDSSRHGFISGMGTSPMMRSLANRADLQLLWSAGLSLSGGSMSACLCRTATNTFTDGCIGSLFLAERINTSISMMSYLKVSTLASQWRCHVAIVNGVAMALLPSSVLPTPTASTWHATEKGTLVSIENAGGD